MDSDADLLQLEAEGKICLGAGAIEDSFWDLPAPRVPFSVLMHALEKERGECRLDGSYSLEKSAATV